MWDEARIITNMQLAIGNGLAAPELELNGTKSEFAIQNDSIKIYTKMESN